MIRIITLSGRAATAKGSRQILLRVFFPKKKLSENGDYPLPHLLNGMSAKLFWAKFGVIMH